MLNTSNKWVFDIEASGLLDHSSIDYLTLPFKLKKSFSVWCAVFKDIDTGLIVRIRPHEIKKIAELLSKADMIVAHNGINYDLLLVKLYFGLDYTINPYDYTQCKIGDKTCTIIDTLVLSQYLQPDRLGGHSLKVWGERLNNAKGTYGEEEEAWGAFSEDMLEYCEQDVELTHDVLKTLMKEWGNWDHAKAFSLEQAINEMVTRQEHIGFWYDIDKAEIALKDLNGKLAQIEYDVEPKLPKIKMAKTNAAKYALPKKQINKDNTPSSSMENWADRHNAPLFQDEYGDWYVAAFEQKIKLPCDNAEPLVTHAPMQMADQKQMKQYLVHLGWNPIVWGQRDITLKSGTKYKVSFGKYKEAVERYCKETAQSTFRKARLEFLQVKSTKEMYEKLIYADLTRPVRVLTSPKYTVDQDKTICPNLIKLGAQVDWVEQVVLWLTYRHRRNMIKSPNGTGALNNPRLQIDGRIPTGAQATGTNTYRFKHRGSCVNVPRPSSVYGGEIRELFGCDPSMKQIGCDAASLEGRVQGHYCYPYEDGVELAKTLIAEKPNDIHSVRGRLLGISRDDAKAITYACLPTDNTEVLRGDNEWVKFNELKLNDKVVCFDSLECNITERKINKILASSYVDVFEIKLECGGRLEGTYNHRWLLEDGITYKRTDELEQGDKLMPLDSDAKVVVDVCKSRDNVEVFCLNVSEFNNFAIRQNGVQAITGNCMYGAQPPKLKSMLGCTLPEAKDLYENFWSSTPALSQLKERVEKYWAKNGKRYIIGIDGRKVMTRSKHSLLNALFQSAGIILMKWAAVFVEEDLQGQGLLFKPFDDNSWEGKAAQMQHYHDEYQYQVCPSLVEGEGSIVATIMEECITKAGSHLNCRVEFAGEAMVGMNWKECH